jgi:hypothetical protein
MPNPLSRFNYFFNLSFVKLRITFFFKHCKFFLKKIIFEYIKSFFSLALQPQFRPWPTSMKLTVSLPFFLDLRQSVGLLGPVISSSQGLYLYTNTEKRTHTHTNTNHPCPGWDSNRQSRLPSVRRQ